MRWCAGSGGLGSRRRSRWRLGSGWTSVAQIAGTRETWIHTFQTDGRVLGAGHAQLGLGTRHRGLEFLVAPDTVKRLGAGEAILIRKASPDARHVRIYRPAPPEVGFHGERQAEIEAAHRQMAYHRTYGPKSDAPAGAVDEDRSEAA